MARKSTAALAVLTGLRERPQPPAELSQEEAELWRSIVAGKPPEWFGADTFPLLVAYCRAVSRARAIAKMIDELGDKVESTLEAVAAFEKLYAMEDKQSRLLTVLATKMRLSQQSKYGARNAETAARTAGAAAKPWEFGKADAGGRR